MRLPVFVCQKNVKQSENVKLGFLFGVVRVYFVALDSIYTPTTLRDAILRSIIKHRLASRTDKNPALFVII